MQPTIQVRHNDKTVLTVGIGDMMSMFWDSWEELDGVPENEATITVEWTFPLHTGSPSR